MGFGSATTNLEGVTEMQSNLPLWKKLTDYLSSKAFLTQQYHSLITPTDILPRFERPNLGNMSLGVNWANICFLF